MDNLITLSHATYVGPSGATAAATYRFFSQDYKPPSQERFIDKDVVKNQNGIFKYLYDNGPGFQKWSPFTIHCERAFATEVGATPAAQYARLRQLWNHPGVLQLSAPEGIYTVHWAGDHERAFRVFPRGANTDLEYTVVVQFEEGQ